MVALKNQKWFYDKDFYTMLNDYIDSAPEGANEAVQKPRYHGAPGNCGYCSRGKLILLNNGVGGRARFSLSLSLSLSLSVYVCVLSFMSCYRGRD